MAQQTLKRSVAERGAKTRRVSDAEVQSIREHRSAQRGEWAQRFAVELQQRRQARQHWHQAQASGLAGLALPGGRRSAFAGGQASHSGLYAPLGVRGVIGRFYRKYEPLIDGGWPMKIGFWQPSDQETEPYRMTGEQYQMEKWQGERQVRQKTVYTYQIKNEVFEMSDEFSSDDFRRDKTGQILQRVGEMSSVASDHWEELLSTLMESGASTADYTGGNFFSSHSSFGGSLVNDLTASELTALNVTTAAAPTQAEAATICTGIFEKFLGMTNEASRPLNGNLKRIGIMVPPNMATAFIGATQSERLTSGESNILRSQTHFTIEVMVNPFLSSTTIGYAYRLDSETKPFILQEEVPVLARALGLGSEYEVFNRHVFFGVEAVRNVGFGEPSRAIRFTLS